MTDPYQVILHDAFAARLRQLKEAANLNPRGADARLLTIAIEAAKVLAAGQEKTFKGERLGYSAEHYDLRDCAEIKVAVVREQTRSGKPRGPSHRMIYREFHGTEEDPRPIRQIIAFEHRADGLPFAVAARALRRTKGRAVDTLKHLPTAKPAIGGNKEPDAEVTPPRLPLPPDIAIALATRHRTPPGRAGEPAAAPQPAVRRPRRAAQERAAQELRGRS